MKLYAQWDEVVCKITDRSGTILYVNGSPAVYGTLEEGFESAMMVMFLPSTIRKLFRTSNHLERVNRELKRRSKVIGIFPNEASILRLMGSVLLEIHNRYSALNSLTISWKIGESLPSLSDSLKKAAAEEYQLLLMA